MTLTTERQQFAEQNEMSMEFANWFFDEKKEGCGNAWFIMAAAMWEGWKGRANREAQPVALVDRRPAASGSICWQNGGKDLPHGTELFTAPPAPAVPDEVMPGGLVYSSALPAFESNDNNKVVGYSCFISGDTRIVESQEQAYADAKAVINACRAAMLAQPVSSGYKLPDNVRDALTLALQAMEFMGDTLNNIDAVCTEDVEYVTPAFNAVRELLAAAPEGRN